MQLAPSRKTYAERLEPDIFSFQSFSRNSKSFAWCKFPWEILCCLHCNALGELYVFNNPIPRVLFLIQFSKMLGTGRQEQMTELKIIFSIHFYCLKDKKKICLMQEYVDNCSMKIYLVLLLCSQ